MSDEPFILANRLALTVAEAAQVLGVSKRHLSNLRSELPTVYLGSKPVIPVDALRKYLDEHVEIGADRIQSAVDEVMESFDDTSKESY